MLYSQYARFICSGRRQLANGSGYALFPKGKEGKITIQLRRGNKNRVTLTVSDNGIGFPDHVDFRKSPSLKLTLVNTLVEQLDGTIEMDRSGGTAFTIMFG